MKAAFRWMSLRFATLLVATLAAMGPSLTTAAPSLLTSDRDSHAKEVVGNWEGTFSMGADEIKVRLELHAEKDKIVGSLTTPHGPWAVTDARLIDGKWNIDVKTPDNNTGFLRGALSGDKWEGNYGFPPAFAGDFKLTRVK